VGTMQCAPPLPPPMNSPQELLRELHRRSVWQVVGLYLATSWGVLNAVDVLTGFAGLPDWTPTMALVLLLIGFPIVEVDEQYGIPRVENTLSYERPYRTDPERPHREVGTTA